MNELVHNLMLTSAQKNPEAEALRINEHTLQYKELDQGSAAIASYLNTLHLEPEHCIGLFMGKCIESVVSIYGTLRAGAVYVPLDIKNPAQRIHYIVEQCCITTFITTPDYVEQLTNILSHVNLSFKIIVLTEEVWVAPANNVHYIIINPFTSANEFSYFNKKETPTESLAAILYTSGSTGVPKGVMISHNCVSIFIEWVIEYFQLRPEDRCISHAPLHFDLSLLDIFATHSAGACAVLVPDNMTGNPKFITQYIANQKITVWQSVPSVLVLLIKYGDIGKNKYPHLRHVMFAGERVSGKILESLSRHFNNAAFHNIYGATETNDTFIYSILANKNSFPDPLPIGKALPFVDFMIVDSDNNPVPTYHEGELLVKTPTMMRGYRNLHSQNSALIFEQNQTTDANGFYATRDVVKMQEDGNLLFCGRRDDIVKSNGYRINLLEIENVLQNHLGIRDVAVIPVPDDEVGNRIVAIVTTPPASSISSVELRIFCAQSLPKYAIPHQFEISSTPLPKTSSGKTNKQSLIKSRGHHVEIA